MQLGFYFDQTRCTGCGACQVSCKDWNDIPAGPEKWMRVLYNEEGEYPNVFVSNMVGPCFHCTEPVCAMACPVSAISKRAEDGIVLVDSEVCLGNKECNEKCLKACPYDAPQFAPGEGAKMRKCTLCVDRVEAGKQPICVDACPVRALDSGSLDELKAKYVDSGNAPGFKYSKRTQPALVIKAKQKRS